MSSEVETRGATRGGFSTSLETNGERMTPRILIIAGSDSGGGAGIQADIKTVTMLGGHAMTAITAITAQNTLGVTNVLAIPAALVVEQINVVASDIGVDAVKIGMIGSPEIVHAVAARLEVSPSVPIVFDPVMVASSGSVLADEATVAAFERLIAVASLVTPNLPELQVLSGRSIGNAEDAAEAAAELAARTGTAVLAKGGHLPGPLLTDQLVEHGQDILSWSSERIDTRHTHGTGCTLASAIATGLGAGLSMADAVEQGRAYTRAALLAAPGLGAGHGPMGHALGSVPFRDIHRK